MSTVVFYDNKYFNKITAMMIGAKVLKLVAPRASSSLRGVIVIFHVS